MLPRFYLPQVNITNDQIIISDKEIIDQLTKVLRLKTNDLFIVFAPQAEYQLALKEIGDKTAIATIIETQPAMREPGQKLTLYQSLLKKDNFEWILQKGTELGISCFVPMITNHTIVREISENKLKRYHKILTEATEQCGGRQVPELKNLLPFNQAIAAAAQQPGQKLIAWEGQTDSTLEEKLDPNVQYYHIFIGPEGGFSPQEVELAKHDNFTPVSLGNRILRAETAAIAAASLILLSQ
ncbi:16S rRNA (uracil(1498)-N(3))-methyltransferase [Patescibacteria group bacterium]|nr:16S rRNA (uracil(1498)-N(3))-methyltransferase [Patescibacteria group bacterium]